MWIKKPKREMVTALAIAGGIILLLAVVKFVKVSRAIAEHSNFRPPPEAVTSVIAAETQWTQRLSAVGSLAPVQGVMLSAEESGKVVRISFESGAMVAKGDVLVELDTVLEEANLAGARARREKAAKELVRVKNLRATNIVSASDLDKAESEARASDAEVAGLEAVIARKKIVAPFAGQTGIREVNIGQYLSPGTPVVPLQGRENLYANFSLPQQSLTQIAEGQVVEITVDAFPTEVFKGTVHAINPQVERTTRNVDVQATVGNTSGKLRAGMYVNVNVILENSDTLIPLPATSISYAPYGDAVYVLEQMKGPDGSEYLGVRQQIVQLGMKRGDQVAVLKGIKPGEQIATSGLFKLRPGAAVSVNNNFAPSNELAPQPANN